MRRWILILCLLGILLSGTGMVSAEMVGNYTIWDMEISPMYEEIVPIDDGKEIVLVEGWGYLEIWRQIVITDLVAIFEGTVLEWPLIIFSPVIFALLGFISVFIYTSRKNQKISLPQEKILAYLNDNSGSTQQQIISAVGASRGSVCYHLHALEKQNKIHPVTRNGRSFYYTSKDSGDMLEQTIHYLLSREKSGKFLQTLYLHPGITRKELAGQLGITPATVRWYLIRYMDERVCRTEKCGKEYCYSLTDEAREICERFVEESVAGEKDQERDG
ncbi:winged helix-turn-helix transcriptional regulator [Methanorbis furvi]|uniref:HTH arsR-type domain-containing protein n=1 Tax=Methanorbis furvi TaxID=3028299 RepID=A0AAE4MCC9_9EURY|nr:hypothetical protein [Methanocorpusculaceae archaeon Ag1]